MLTFPVTQTVNWVGIHMLYNHPAGAYIPDKVTLECMDGKTQPPYTSLASWNRPNYIAKPPSIPPLPTDIIENPGEYVFGNTAAINKTCKKVVLTLVGNQGWHFLSEIEMVGK